MTSVVHCCKAYKSEACSILFQIVNIATALCCWVLTMTYFGCRWPLFDKVSGQLVCRMGLEVALVLLIHRSDVGVEYTFQVTRTAPYAFRVTMGGVSVDAVVRRLNDGGIQMRVSASSLADLAILLYCMPLFTTLSQQILLQMFSLDILSMKASGNNKQSR